MTLFEAINEFKKSIWILNGYNQYFNDLIYKVSNLLCVTDSIVLSSIENLE